MRVLFLTAILALALAGSGCGKKRPDLAVVEFDGPANLTVTIRGKAFSGDPLRLKLRPGQYTVRYDAPGFQTRWSVETFSASEAQKRIVSLEPVRSAVLITSTPAGAEVMLDNRIKGNTPLVIGDLAAGKYTAQLRRPGFGERQISWEITDARPRPLLMVKLEPNSSKILIASTPAGARLTIDGQAVGVTPYSVNLEEGNHLLKLELQGHNAVIEELAVTRGRAEKREFKLTPMPGTLTVTSKPAGAEVFLNGEKRGSTPITLENIAPGNYKIRLTKAGFDPAERTVPVAPGDRNGETAFTLSQATGTAVFTVRPAGLNVYLDGESVGRSKADPQNHGDTIPFVFRNLAPGKHKLTIEHRRASPQSTPVIFEIAKGQRYTPKPIEIWVDNCVVTYNDGTTSTGVLYKETEDEVFFGPERGISYSIKRSLLKSVVKLDIDDPAQAAGESAE